MSGRDMLGHRLPTRASKVLTRAFFREIEPRHMRSKISLCSSNLHERNHISMFPAKRLRPKLAIRKLKRASHPAGEATPISLPLDTQ